jgi:hypothetical protein
MNSQLKKKLSVFVMTVFFCVTSFCTEVENKLSVLIQSTNLIDFTVNSANIKNIRQQIVKEYSNTSKSRILTESLRPQIYINPELVKPASGGISDGGGNAVGAQLFDFYENEGSYVLKTKEVIRWNSELATLFLRANYFLPNFNGTKTGLGSQLLSSLKSKKWILETKPLTQRSCINDSSIQNTDQQIVGCQNFYEIRISADWLLRQANSKNQAGLIFHEVLLAWVTSLNQNQSKAESEFKVRELNRLINTRISPEEFSSEFNKLFSNLNFENGNDFRKYND